MRRISEDDVFAIHEFHGEERLAVGFADIEDAADVGVRDLARQAHFAGESRQSFFVARERLRQEFQRDGLPEFQILGAIHFAHAALAERRNNAIAVEQRGAGNVAGFVAKIGRMRRRSMPRPRIATLRRRRCVRLGLRVLFHTGSNSAGCRGVNPRHGRRRTEIYRRRARRAKRRPIRQLTRARRAFHQELWIRPRVAPSYASPDADTTNLRVQLAQVRSRTGGDA